MKITVQVSLSVYGSEEYLDGFSIISAGSHLPADIYGFFNIIHEYVAWQ